MHGTTSLAFVRGRPWLASLLLGLLALLLGSLAVTPARAPLGDLGAAYVGLAAHPLGDAPNPVAGRILTPLASWLLGLRGEGLLLVVMAVCLLLPTVAARAALARGLGLAGAALLALALASTLVVRTSLHCGAYPDVTTYLALLGVWLLRRHPRRAALCWFLALLDHERALLLGPWVVALLMNAGDDRPRPGQQPWPWLAPLLTLLVWFALHTWLEARRPVDHSTVSYLRPLLDDPLHNLRSYGIQPLIGWASALQWVWLVPLWWCVALVRRRRWRLLLVQVALPVGAAAAAMMAAYDWSRMAVLAFPCLLPALEEELASGEPGPRRRLAWLLGLQVLSPQVFTAWIVVEIFPSWALPW